MKIGNIIFSAIIFLVGLIFFVTSLGFGPGTSGDVGVGFFPKIVSIFVMALSVIIIFQEIKKNNQEILLTNASKKALLVALIMVIYVIVMNFIGFIIATPIVIATMLYLVGEKDKIKLVAIPVGITALVYVCFVMGLNVRLPISFLGI